MMIGFADVERFRDAGILGYWAGEFHIGGKKDESENVSVRKN